MKKNYQYHLASPSEQRQRGGKWFCPACGRKSFVCYLDTDGNLIDESVGRCDHEQSCGEHYKPSEYFRDNNISGMGGRRPSKPRHMNIEPIKPPVYISGNLLKATRRDYDINNLVVWLAGEFGLAKANQMIEHYHIGTVYHHDGADVPDVWSGARPCWQGSTVFYQVDCLGNVHRGTIMQFNPMNGKRVKFMGRDGEEHALINSVHALMGLGEPKPRECLFGEHLLRRYPQATVAVVESQKTALIGFGATNDIFNGVDIVWVASGGLSKLSPSSIGKWSILQGRDVVLFPDNGCFDLWGEKAVKVLKPIAKRLRISKTMELHATNGGDDIGDLIIEDTWSHNMEFVDFLKSELVEL